MIYRYRRSLRQAGPPKIIKEATILNQPITTLEVFQNPKPKKLLDQLREIIRLKHYSHKTEETFNMIDQTVYSVPQQAAPHQHGTD